MTEQRMTIHYCPYCGDEDLRPHEPAGSGDEPRGAWECRSCVRVFAVRFLGLSTTVLEVKR